MSVNALPVRFVLNFMLARYVGIARSGSRSIALLLRWLAQVSANLLQTAGSGIEARGPKVAPMLHQFPTSKLTLSLTRLACAAALLLVIGSSRGASEQLPV